MYYSQNEVGNIRPTTLGEKPINPKTNHPYGRGTKSWWRWYYGLSDKDKGILADFEAMETL